MLKIDQELRRWTVAEAADLYEVQSWGNGYFAINSAGHVSVHPTKSPERAIDLKELIDRLTARGIQPPVLVRFGDVLQHRLTEIRTAFQTAINDHNYKAPYQCIYPIKVNQQRQVVEELLRFGRPHHFGLEAGSKPELMAVIAMADNEVPIVCNGFKDERFIETALLAQKIGRRTFLVVEKYTDLELILRYAHQLDVRPRIGVRLKLSSPGSGRWQSCGGYRSKFGLTAGEILRLVDELKSRDLEDCLKLLHFHLGSQITNIRHIKRALTEASRVYVDLVRQGAGLECLDVGGGLGVDYDGSQTTFESSANYTLQEYANDVVFHVQSVCDEAGVEHPAIFSESGRAVAAYHSVLVFNVLGVADRTQTEVSLDLADEAPKPLVVLRDTHRNLSQRNLRESYHDAQQELETATTLFRSGYISLADRSQAESLFWAICRKIQRMAAQLDDLPEEFEGLDAMLSQTYFSNFSIFQSMPDSWAIKQLFPIMPIGRLDEPPTCDAVLADITCDSDGRVDRFINRRDVKRTLPVHELDERPYYLAAFLVGAYQEILGDLHNLFGDTNAVHVSLDADGQVAIDTVIPGDTVREVLQYVQFDCQTLLVKLRASVEEAIREGRIDDRQANSFLQSYQAGLEGYTYLEGPRERGPLD